MITVKELKTKEKKGVVVTLFDRYGGNTIGYKMAGLKVYMNINKDKNCNKVYRFNNKDVFVYEEQLEKIKNKNLKKIIKDKRVDILDICLPEIKFAKTKDLFKVNPIIVNIFCIIKELIPKVVVIHMNNNILKNNKRIYLNTILDSLEELDYVVNYEKLNVKHYEVPQLAEYVCIICVHKNVGIEPIFPETNGNFVSVKNSISEFLDIDADTQIKPYYEKLLKQIPFGSSLNDIKKILKEVDEIYFDLKILRRDKWESPYYALYRYSREKPIHPIKPRYMHFNELLRLQTFPDDYILLGNEKEDLKNLCLSIPPNYVKCIAESISKYILNI